MLPPERAQETLKSLHDAAWEERCRRRVGSLPGKMGDAGLAIAGGTRAGALVDWRAQRKALLGAGAWLDAASDADRQRVFAALFPQLAPHVERAWSMLTRLPYQQREDRKAFRAPYTPVTTQPARAYWLRDLYEAVAGYERDVTWFAAWAPHLAGALYRYRAADTLGLLCAAAIEAGGPAGDEVFHILVASAKGEHEVGSMGRHVARALLVASRPEGWQFLERLLLAAQREEGLRQVILEAVDEAHPEAFRRMVRLVLEHDLARFSAVVRAVDVWFGLAWDSASPRPIYDALACVLRFLEEPGVRDQALLSGDARDLYLALWTLAFDDAVEAVAPAAQLLTDPDVERRYVGAHVLAQLGLRGSSQALLPALDDEDLRVVARAVDALKQGPDASLLEMDLFERLERVLGRLKHRTVTLKPVVWPWTACELRREAVAGLLPESLGKRSPSRLVPYVPLMRPFDRSAAVKRLAEAKEWSGGARELFLTLVGDPSQDVRGAAVSAVAQLRIEAEEATRLEGLLDRKPGDLRRGVLALLLGQSDEGALASATRLLEAKNPQQRQAGLELLRLLVEARRCAARSRSLAQGYRSRRTDLSRDEQEQLEVILQAERRVPTLDDALGLLDPRQRTAPETPPALKNRRDKLYSRLKTPLVSQAAVACLHSLDELVHSQRQTVVTLEFGGDRREFLLGSLGWGLPDPRPELPEAEDRARLPLAQLWETWWAERPGAQRDRDGLELLRAVAQPVSEQRRTGDPPWVVRAHQKLYAPSDTVRLRYKEVVHSILTWLLRLHPPAGAVDYLLDAVEFTFALVPHDVLAASSPQGTSTQGWRNDITLARWLDLARQYLHWRPDAWTPPHHVRLWRLLRWRDEPVTGADRLRPYLRETIKAFEAGAATEADLLDHLLGPRAMGPAYHPFGDLWDCSDRKPAPFMAGHPILADLVQRCRRRIIEVELERGEMPTAATAPALALRWSGGLDTLGSVLRALGKDDFVRGWASDSQGREAVFSHLVRASFPGGVDTAEVFATRMQAEGIPPTRMIELAVYAPQWADHVEQALGWPGLTEAVWWLHAHTKDQNWHVGWEMRDSWAAHVAERTPLAGQRLLDGAVDVAWFRRTYETLGAERWGAIYAAAEYASGGAGHKRAQLYADALLGRVDEETLLARMAGKRLQDAVRAVGLLPLPAATGREEALLRRYEALQEFLRTSHKFGAMRRENERLAVEIGLENLARTAGYRDPLRLQWAMEAQANADLAGGPIEHTVDGVTVALSIDRWGAPQLAVSKGDKPLKALPARVKKHPEVAALEARQRELKRQAARMRQSLEEAMCRGDAFGAADLQRLAVHPVLAPLLEELVFAGDGLLGYPVEGGGALLAHDGRLQPLDGQAELHIAHPCDLLATGEWHEWQRDCFVAERMQPFKQVFRELYLLTSAEREERTLSRRYAGQQVNGGQAVGLWKARGWVVHPEEGIRRTFHDQGLTAWVQVLGLTLTPADVEGLTIEGVGFSRRDNGRPVELAEVPPRMFSEVMRDLDLVVSVAHRGGVDPEASASTVEMRAALLHETLALLKIDNVRLEGRRALVQGQLGSYSVHLGSGTVHRQPGGALCIVPVHAQHRGRLFLPFADDDPKTAEVLSKVLLLARDHEIKDPTILEQILAGG